MRALLLSFVLLCRLPVLFAQAPPGQWRELLPYNSTIDLAFAGEQVFAATPWSLYAVDPASGEMERYSRITGLSETGIQLICADTEGKRLLLAYSNSNLDILQGNQVKNIPDIKRDNMPGDKTIYQATPSGNLFYLSTGLGVIVVDAQRGEIKEQWLAGTGAVKAFATGSGFYYAATPDGLKRIPANDPRPADPSRWQLISGQNGLPAGGTDNIFLLGNKMIAQQGNTLYGWDGNNWTVFYTGGWPLIQASVSENKLLLCERQTTGPARIVILQASGATERLISQTAAVSFPRKAMLINNTPWVADQFAALSQIQSDNSHINYQPSSPQGIAGGDLLVYDKTLYAASGAVNDAWNYQYNGEGLFILQEGNWNNVNRYRFPLLDSLLDFLSLAIDKRDGSLWAGSYGGGLLQVKPENRFRIYKQGYIGNTSGDPGSYRVAGLAFDQLNHLWVSNFGSSQPLKVRLADSSWAALAPPFALFENALGQLVVDDNNFKWMQAPLGNGLLCFDDAQTPSQTGDDRWRRYGAGTGNGNLPSSDVLCLAKDRSGFIWVGTTDGIGVIQCTELAFSAGGCEAYRPVVANGNFAGFLFKGQRVTHIAVDGADRKWVATSGGVFLISAEGDKVLDHFTETNSPLLSNDVRKIAVDGYTGEVFIATAKGICAYRGFATEGSENKEEVLVFPNPVPPGYTGPIAIRGLRQDAQVKITETDGRLVYQTRALGGQATWDGTNYRGQRISSGVYLVLVRDESGRENVTAKIFFISR